MLGMKLNLGGVGNLGNGMIDNGKTKIYLKDGRKHRVNGPAETRLDGYEAWFKEGSLHREGGLPAVSHPDGRLEFWVDGKKVK